MNNSQAKNPADMETGDLFLKNLRAVTGPAHEALEQNRYTTVLMTPEVTVADYLTYLKRLYGFIAPVEALVYPAMESVFPDARNRMKAARIPADLQALGVPAEEINTISLFDAASVYTTDAAKAAAMYVLEGSSLGGNVIFRHLHKTIGIAPEKGAAYLTTYGPATGTMWKDFIRAFADFAVARDCETEVIHAAAATFRHIDNWLTHQS